MGREVPGAGLHRGPRPSLTGAGGILVSFAAAVGSLVALRAVVSLELPGVRSLLRIPLLPRETLGVAWSPRALWPTDLQASGVDRLAGLVACLFLAAVGVALLNALVLLLDAGAARRRELAVRSAVGAGPGAVLALLLRQARAMAVTGGALGLLSGLAGGAALRAAWPEGVDPVAWGAAASELLLPLLLLTGLCAVAYLWTGMAVATRRELAAELASGARSTEGGAEAFRRRVLAALQMGVAGAVAVAAVALARSATPATEGVALERDTVAVPVTWTAGAAGPEWGGVLRALAGVDGVGTASLASPGALVGLGVRDHATSHCGDCYRGGLPLPFWGARADHHAVAPGFFQAAGMVVSEGRGLTPTDGPDAPLVVVINRTFANTSFEEGRPVGRRVRIGAALDAWFEVVGVVEDGPRTAVGGDDLSRPAVYVSALQRAPRSGEVLVTASPGGLAGALDVLTREGLEVGEPRTLDQVAAEAVAPLAWMARLAWLLGGLTLALTLHGVHVTALQVTRRRVRELAIRRVLGAGPRHLLALVLGSSARTAGPGVFLALLFGSALTALLRKAAAGIPAPGPGTYAGLGLVMLAAAVVASVRAGREALRIQPAEALE